MSVQQQWESEKQVIYYAWDFEGNSYSEAWYQPGWGIRFQQATTNGKKTQYYLGVCATVNDMTVWSDKLTSTYISYFNNKVGDVSDPFFNT